MLLPFLCLSLSTKFNSNSPQETQLWSLQKPVQNCALKSLKASSHIESMERMRGPTPIQIKCWMNPNVNPYQPESPTKSNKIRWKKIQPPSSQSTRLPSCLTSCARCPLPALRASSSQGWDSNVRSSQLTFIMIQSRSRSVATSNRLPSQWWWSLSHYSSRTPDATKHWNHRFVVVSGTWDPIALQQW